MKKNIDNRPQQLEVIDLSKSNSGAVKRTRSLWVEGLWHYCEIMILDNRLIVSSRLRKALLCLFGATIGENCLMRHPFRVKFPWNLVIGANCWIGEDVWIQNQAKIIIGSNVCLSQGTFLTTGSHDLANSMNLTAAPITIEDGVWISSMCVIQMGVVIGRSTVIAPLSVVHRSLGPGGVYGGNPLRHVRERFDKRGGG